MTVVGPEVDTEQAIADAIGALLTTALAPKAVYGVDEVPVKRPDEHVVFKLERRFGGVSRSTGQKGLTGWRLITSPASRGPVSNARMMRDFIRPAIENVCIDAGGVRTSTPVQFETEDPIEAENGWFTGDTEWTFAI